MAPPFSSAEGSFDRTINVTGLVDLEVTSGSGAIEVFADGAGTVRVHGAVKARDDFRSTAEDKMRYIETNPPIEAFGNSIRIGRIEDPVYRNNISISYEIHVPPDTKLAASTGSGSHRIEGLRREVSATTGSGSISIANVQGDVNAKTGSGEIDIHSLTGRADLQTGSGSIRATDISGSVRSGTGSGEIALEFRSVESGAPVVVAAQTGSGEIEVSGIVGSLKASTGSGSIQVRGNPIKDWDVQTSSGSITLTMTPEAAFDFHARASSGQITADLPIEVQGKVGGKELQGKVRGGGSLVNASSGSGSITIR
jgi:DUF4097 and DUF4098 domain-containing protein YvlB